MHPDVDELQMGHSMRAAKLRDIESTTGTSANTYFFVLKVFQGSYFR